MQDSTLTLVEGVQFNLNEWALTDAHSPYQKISSCRLKGREISKYVLRDGLPSTIDHAVYTVKTLLTDNPSLCLISRSTPETMSEDLREAIQAKRYLIINGEAVCFSQERNIPNGIAVGSKFQDQYFSQTLLSEPVVCPQGHVFEKESAELWMQHKGNKCPAPGPQHEMGELEVDADLKAQIDDFRQQEERERLALVRLEQQAEVPAANNTPAPANTAAPVNHSHVSSQPPLTKNQKRELQSLFQVYDKSATCRFVDGIVNSTFTFGIKGRSDADRLSKFARIFLDYNKSLHGGTYVGIRPGDLKTANRLITLYNKNNLLKAFDGFGNFLLGGNFGRSDALDLVKVIKRIHAANEAQANHLNGQPSND